MELYVVRHGQTSGNAERVIDGSRRDTLLNDIGVEQAHKTKEMLKDIKFDLIICSPLKRTIQTTNIINIDNVPVILEPRVIERDCGEFAGKSYDSLDMNVYWNYYDKTQYECVESLPDLFKRVYNYLDDIKDKYCDKRILIVSHGGVSKAIQCYFHGIPKDGDLYKIGLNNCEIAKYIL